MAVLSCKCGWWGSIFIHSLQSPTGPSCGSSNSLFFLLSCHDAHICKLYGAQALLPFSFSCNECNALWQRGSAMLDRFALFFFWSRVSAFLFAAYAVIANGQVECPKGFKRMNLTHCQGKLQYMFENVSAGINPPYIFMGDLIKKTKLLEDIVPWI